MHPGAIVSKRTEVDGYECCSRSKRNNPPAFPKRGRVSNYEEGRETCEVKFAGSDAVKKYFIGDLDILLNIDATSLDVLAAVDEELGGNENLKNKYSDGIRNKPLAKNLLEDLKFKEKKFIALFGEKHGKAILDKAKFMVTRHEKVEEFEQKKEVKPILKPVPVPTPPVNNNFAFDFSGIA